MSLQQSLASWPQQTTGETVAAGIPQLVKCSPCTISAEETAVVGKRACMSRLRYGWMGVKRHKC